MYNGNTKYRKGMLRVIEEDLPVETFSMSSPTKISSKSNRAFSIPAGPDFSCPGATTACEGCYAQHGRHFFSNVQRAFARNWKLLKKFEAAKDEVGCAQELSRHMPKDGLFRIHESGDFHSQFAVNVWAMVVAANPNVDFYAYTRTFDIAFEPLLENSNFVLWASTDEFNHAAATVFVKEYEHYNVRHAYGPWDHAKAIPDNSVVCPATSGKIEVLNACTKCKMCVIPNRISKNILFLAH